MTNQQALSVRDCALTLTDLARVHDADFPEFSAQATPLVRELLSRHDLLTLGVPLPGTESGPKLLYYDGELTIVMGLRPPHRSEPAHDHTKWEMVGLYTGSIDHTLYRRLDDGTVDGYAELEVSDQRTLHSGEIVWVPEPPHDIHSFTSLKDATWILAIIPGWLPPIRRYFDLERKSYFLGGSMIRVER